MLTAPRNLRDDAKLVAALALTVNGHLELEALARLAGTAQRWNPNQCHAPKRRPAEAPPQSPIRGYLTHVRSYK